MAVEAQLGVVGEGGTELDEAGAEVVVKEIDEAFTIAVLETSSGDALPVAGSTRRCVRSTRALSWALPI